MYLKNDAIQKLESERSKYKVQCKCGTKTIMIDETQTICRGCGHWLFKDKQDEFKYRLKEMERKLV